MVAVPPSPAIVNTAPVVAPDGSRIAYWHQVGGARRATLIVMRASGTGKRALTTAGGREAAWSPDGKLIAYVDREIYVVAASGGKPRRLTHEYATSGGGPANGLDWPSWRDNDTIDYVVDDCCFLGGVSYTYAASVTLAGKQTDNPDVDCEYTASCDTVAPDGRHRFRVTRALPPATDWNVTLSGDDMQPLDLGETDTYAFSSTGRYAMWATKAGIVVAFANATHQTLVDGFDGAWSPADTFLAYVRNATLFVGAGDGTGVHPVATSVADAATGPLWSAHERWLAFPTERARRVTTMIARPDGTDAHALVHWHVRATRKGYDYHDTWSSLDWAPDDAFAVYYDRCGRGYAIYRVDAETGRARRLTQCR